MSSDRWWWAQKAQRLRFEQLDVARRHAESWRTGLAGISALLGAAFVVKGRDTVAQLPMAYRVSVLVAFGAALALLVTATLVVIRAASGAPGEEILLNGEQVERWTRWEAGRVWRAVAWARTLTVAGIVAAAAGVCLSSLAPAELADSPLVTVDTPAGRFCGRVLPSSDQVLRIGTADDYRLIPLTAVIHVTAATSC